jgi:hypothetical protein
MNKHQLSLLAVALAYGAVQFVPRQLDWASVPTPDPIPFAFSPIAVSGTAVTLVADSSRVHQNAMGDEAIVAPIWPSYRTEVRPKNQLTLF